MHYFVTGATGFIGKRLRARNCWPGAAATVSFLVRPGQRGQGGRPAGGLGRVGQAGHRRQRRPDRSASWAWRSETMKALKGQIDAVYHLAAVYDLGADEESQIAVNVEGTRNVGRICQGD